ncbi:RagB/SusD family nutrient uptake outer membrane protein [Flavobacterium sp. RHBU_24]|uniref:RagB/SusD family nutrient uptake outer membrane protein n=1 Tax=Flavobacterium sp. RHBU_24 TaxID=3391185 RepID=UPI003985294E
MKRSLIYSLVAASLIAVGCSDDFLEPARDTSVLTSRDIAENVDQNPDLVKGTLDGIYSYMIDPMANVANAHYDIGQKGVDIWTDIVCGDMALSASAYGWYDNTANLLSTVDLTRTENRIIWRYYYNIIGSANGVIQSLGGNDAVLETDETRHIMGQARALRAYGYFYLAQLFQRGYNPDQAILPYDDLDTQSNAKVPASQIYSLIISDLNVAIELLNDYSRDLKHKMNKPVAQGLLAYTYAAMGDYQNARTMSEAIITSGQFPLTTRAQLANPGQGSGFNDANTGSWIWGYDITESMGMQLVNWWGQVDYFSYSYAWAGDKKAIDNALYAQIPSTDIRKSQFGGVFPATTALMPINKFFDQARVPGEQYYIDTDYIFMRVDEFYLLSAEASAALGDDAAAKNRLTELLTARYNTTTNLQNYVTPLAGQTLKDAIYLQTRIELWGEGKSYLAMKRNRATVTRGTNHIFRPGESFSYDQDEMSFQIPQIEINNNPAITEQN